MTRIARHSHAKHGCSRLLSVGLVCALLLFVSVYFWSAGRLLGLGLDSSSVIHEIQHPGLQVYLESTTVADDEAAAIPSPIFNASFAKYLKKGLSRYVEEYKGGRPYHYNDSSYPHRRPNVTLPYWFMKVFPLNKHLSPDKQTCFVHVGKAGGSTIGCMLGFLIHCGDDKKTNFQTVPSLLSGTTAHSFHRGVYDCPEEVAKYLFVMRNPLARALSAFNYAKPDLSEEQPFSRKFNEKEIFVDCNFWTLNDLAERGLMKSGHNTTEECRLGAKNALLGTGKNLVHWYYNYQYYYETVPSHANIIVIRNEHIVDDWNSVETMLGGVADFTKESLPVNNQYEKKPEDVYLSEEAKVVLCKTLCNEIQVYKAILKRAQNIRKEQYIESIQELMKSCPKEAIEENCADDMPDIWSKVERAKGELK